MVSNRAAEAASSARSTAWTSSPRAPVFVEASSTAVYGPRRPGLGLLAADTLLDPVDNYGAHKAECERMVAASGLPHVVLRLGAIVHPELLTSVDAESLFMMQIVPAEQRVQAVDVRDAARASATAALVGDRLDGKVLLIGGPASNASTYLAFTEALLDVVGIGRPGHGLLGSGDTATGDGWFVTDWMDTAEAEALLHFQQSDWADSVAFLRTGLGVRRHLAALSGPMARVVLGRAAGLYRRRLGVGPRTTPWALVERRFGSGALNAERVRQPV